MSRNKFRTDICRPTVGFKQNVFCMAPTLKVYDVETGALVANTSHHSSPSNITIGHLSSGASFRVAVFAVNVKGVSAPHVIMAQTMRQALKYTGQSINLSVKTSLEVRKYNLWSILHTPSFSVDIIYYRDSYF